MWRHLSLFSRSRPSLIIKVGVVGMLLTCSVKVLPGCRADKQAGWEIFAICAANFDNNGNYVNSSCHDAPPAGGESSLNTCMEDGAGGCSGSACTWDGPLYE
jgi:hypothetical protein